MSSFPVVHGPYGEDGTLQGLLELANVPYVGAGVLASAVGMDKAVMKTLFAARRLPIVKHVVVWRRDWTANRAATVRAVTGRLSFPMFVKPANLGSSVGITKAKDQQGLEAGLDLAVDFDRKVIVERAVPKAREIECAVLGNDRLEASLPGEVVPSREFYSYEAKYLDEGSALLVPSPPHEAANTAGTAAGGGSLPRGRRGRHGPSGFPHGSRHRPSLPERAEHDSGLYHH